ncbi:hypothetical protein SMICM17S_05430 [Streptomyces microflavus]
MTGHACPECGRRTAGEPGTEHRVPCRCGTDTGANRLMGDELRAARSAEMAAAEDFDPLRIRPYVTLGDGAAAEGGDAASASGSGAAGFGGPGSAGTGSGGPGSAGTGSGGPVQDASGDAATTMPLHLGGGPGPGTGSGTDSRTGMGTGTGPGAGAYPAADESRRRTAAMGAGPGFGAGPAFGAAPAPPTPCSRAAGAPSPPWP